MKSTQQARRPTNEESEDSQASRERPRAAETGGAYTDRPALAWQENLLTLLCHSDEHGRTVFERVPVTMYEGNYKVIAERVAAFWKKYEKAPGAHTADLLAEILEDPQNRRASTFRGILISMLRLNEKIDYKFALDCIDKFLRVQQLKATIIQAADKLKANPDNVEEIEELFRQAGADAPRNTAWRDHGLNAAELLAKKFKPIQYAVPGLIPEGVTMFAARPKLGKSWLFLQLCIARAAGEAPFPETGECLPPADALYLALEDGERRVKGRMRTQFGTREPPEHLDRLQIKTRWRRLADGGLEDLRDWCRSVPAPALVAIDILKKIRRPKRQHERDYDADYEACSDLVELTHEFPGLAIIVSHHDTKATADDVFDTFSGTLGLTGGVDTLAMLKRTAQGFTLHVTGRDVQGIEKAMQFTDGRWSLLGDAEDVYVSEQRRRVLDILKGEPDGLKPAEITAMADLKSDNATYQLLYRMVKDGEIVKLKNGRYRPLRPERPAWSKASL